MMNSINMDRIDKYTVVIHSFGAMKVPVTIYISDKIKIEEEAVKQLRDAACIDPDSFVFATPDIHTGYGVPIGSILASPNIISPSAVGYDINCGMRLLSTPFLLKDIDIKKIAGAAADLIPLGEGKKNLELTETELHLILNSGFSGLEAILPHFNLAESSAGYDTLIDDRQRIEDNGCLNGNADTLPLKAIEKGLSQMGTLGGGNHFIEIQEVIEIFNKKIAEDLGIFKNQVTIMLHSGSRGLGYETAGYYIKLAAKHLASRGVTPPNKQLLYFYKDSKEAKQYIMAMNGAANYAFANREVMTMFVRKAFGKIFSRNLNSQIKTVYDVTHNMAKEEIYSGKPYFVHRKGATRAFDAERMEGTPFKKTGQPVLIPGSMGTASYLLAGTEGAEKSFYSVNHGAGRVMSRKQAAGKKGKPGLITDKEFKNAMQGILLICGNKSRIKEEAPQAYKDIDAVIETVTGAGLAIPVAKMRPIAVLKG